MVWKRVSYYIGFYLSSFIVLFACFYISSLCDRHIELLMHGSSFVGDYIKLKKKLKRTQIIVITMFVVVILIDCKPVNVGIDYFNFMYKVGEIIESLIKLGG